MEVIGLKMNENNINTIRGRIVKQNSQEFIIGVFTIEQILKFTKYTERLIVSYDEDEQPIYNEQVQRKAENGRIQRIADFLINDPLAIFPTNIVLGIPYVSIEKQEIINSDIISDTQFIEIVLKEIVFEEIKKNDGDVFITIIDGQHRIRGIEIAIERLTEVINSLFSTIGRSDSPELQKNLKKEQKRLNDLKNIEFAVSFFIDPSLEYQAMIFSTINRTQKKVSQNLVNSLFGLDSHDTPQKTALEVTLALNSHLSSPFYKRINFYGGNYEKNQSPPLSQATMIRSIVNLISENSREAENDRFKERSELIRKSENIRKNLPFRYYYSKNQDNMISDILFYYFNAVKKTFKDPQENSYWELKNNNINNILQTTVGYEVLLKILCDILENFKSRVNVTLTNETFYSAYLDKAKEIIYSDREKYQFSTRGGRILYLEMSLKIFPESSLNDNRTNKLKELLKN
ncbi:hypothetical protein EZS27_013912 [termite gut metagenome]|uniref:DGQHR domain-containing protein n=1 Tax=termite gut metagenome TaxID=433724 RepID=A0A5J4RX62_9ZZZZ